MDQLTEQDCDALLEALEALEAWKNLDNEKQLNKRLMNLSLCKAEDRERIRQEDHKQWEEILKQQRPKAERIIVLSAKLIGIRDALCAERMSTVTLNPEP